MFITAKIAFIFTSLSAFQIYDFSYIHSRLFTTSRVHLEPTQRPAPSWLVSSVGRALHRYRRGHGFKSRAGLNSFHYYLSSVHNCEDRYHIHVFIRISNFHSRLFISSRVYLEPTQYSVSSWLVSSVGRALHPYRRGHGFKSRISPNLFFSGLPFTTA